MATIIKINFYQSFSDRGAFVQKGAWQTDDIDENEIIVGEKLPHWAGYQKPIVKSYQPGELVLDYNGKIFTIHSGEEVQLDYSLFSKEYGVSCYILECVKLL